MSKKRLSFFVVCGIMAIAVLMAGIKWPNSEVAGRVSHTESEAVETEIRDLISNDFILYSVNCGTENVSQIAQGNYLGLYQSVTDKAYGEDEKTGMKWGYVSQPYYERQGDTLSAELTGAKWIVKEGASINPEETGFYYSFALPEGRYEILCGFDNPFSARTVSVKAEEEIAVSDLKILKYKLTETSFTSQVTDGELNLLIYNPVSGDEVMKEPILSYIIIRKAPDYNEPLLSCLIGSVETAEVWDGEYTSASETALRDALEEARTVAALPYAEQEQYKLAFILLKGAFEQLEARPVYNAFLPGQVWRDEDNNVIQAHGGQVQRLIVADKDTGEKQEKWWWVGEDKTLGNRGGIAAYSSDDLYNWTFEGVVMRNVSSREQLETEAYFISLYEGYTKEQLDNVFLCINDSTSIIERPKMLYNALTKQYIIWFHADGPTETSDSSYAAASAGVAVSDSPNGPFRFIDRYRLNTCPPDQQDMYPQSRGMARDMNLFMDDDGTAYIIYSSEENLTLYIAKLDADYTGLFTEPEKAVYGQDYIRIFPGAQREAPAVFKKDGKYYMMTSGCTGWSPNPAKMFIASEMLGNWEDAGNPCVDDDRGTTFDSQSTCIFLADESTQTYVYMGDRWNSEDLADSRYVWLPVVFDASGQARILYKEEWQLP